MNWKPSSVGTCATCGKLVRLEWAPGYARQVPTCAHLEEIVEADPDGQYRPSHVHEIALGAMLGGLAYWW